MDIEIFPNPNYGSFYMERPDIMDNELVRIAVTNGAGQKIYINDVVMKQLECKTFRIELKDAAPGVYYFHLYNPNMQSVQRFTIIGPADQRNN